MLEDLPEGVKLARVRYSKEFKESIIAKMMPPQNQAVSSLAKETGIPAVTLYAWRRKAREDGFPTPTGKNKSEDWNTQDKFHIVLETATLSELELAKYCREKDFMLTIPQSKF